ncbi:MAG: tyrosine-protein kinase family protein [Candidatus Binataceae bacterium]
MGKYYEALRRSSPREEAREELPEQVREADDDPELEEAPRPSTALVPLPTLVNMPGTIAREGGIRRLTERLAPLSVVDRAVRLMVSGCRPGDGASTIAAALGIDLSQRLNLRTLLVDAHVRHPSLYRFFARPTHRSDTTELVLAEAAQIRPTAWPRLDLASCAVCETPGQRQSLFSELESIFARYSAVVVDLGVARLDARMLPLARPEDPILLVVRYGETERDELATTTAALRAANRSVAGVILNAAAASAAKPGKKV